MDEDMEGQDIDQKEDFETRENTADIAQRLHKAWSNAYEQQDDNSCRKHLVWFTAKTSTNNSIYIPD
jgi:hypothetical protein